MTFMLLPPKGKYKQFAVYCPDTRQVRRFPTRPEAEAFLTQCIQEGRFPIEPKEPRATIADFDPFE